MKNILLVFLVLASFPSMVPGALGQSKLRMKVNITPQANNNNPIALDLILVRSKKLYKELMKISASEWFQKRNQYRLAYPKELSDNSWEWVPGQVVQVSPITVKRGVVGGFIFANYVTPGTHRAVIDTRGNLLVNLGVEDFSVMPLKK